MKKNSKFTPYTTTLTCMRMEKEVEQNVREDVNLGNFVNEVHIEQRLTSLIKGEQIQGDIQC